MTLAVILNVVSMTLLLILLAATMRLPFKLRSGEQVAGQVAARAAGVPRRGGASRRPGGRGTPHRVTGRGRSRNRSGGAARR